MFIRNIFKLWVENPDESLIPCPSSAIFTSQKAVSVTRPLTGSISFQGEKLRESV